MDVDVDVDMDMDVDNGTGFYGGLALAIWRFGELQTTELAHYTLLSAPPGQWEAWDLSNPAASA